MAGPASDRRGDAGVLAPNHAIEKTLRERLESLPEVSMCWRSVAVDYTQDAAGVEVAYTSPAGERTVTADYLVIADWARSPLRKRMNVRLEGTSSARSTAWHIHAPALTDLFKTPLSSITWFLNDDNQADVLIPQSGDGDWLYACAPLKPGVDADDWHAIAPMLFRSVGDKFEVEPLAGGGWTSHARMAPRYDYGRVFLAGDAAHLTPPFGGFGMNLGVGDAVDLGWKLAATLEGWGGPRLLESYTCERQEAARFIIEGSAANGAVLGPELGARPHMEDEGTLGEGVRAEVARSIIAQKTKQAASLGAQFGYRYAASPLVIEDGTDAPPLAFGEYIPSARPGNRAPHLWLDDETSLYDRFGWGFTPLKLDDAAVDAPLRLAAEQRRVPLTVVDLGLAEARELYEWSLVLIRPDQHVAWRGERLPDDCDRLLQTSLARRPRLPRLSGAQSSAPDDVVNLEDLRLTRMFECDVGENRHDARAERLQLLLRVPHLAHEQLTIREKRDVIVETVRGHLA